MIHFYDRLCTQRLLQNTKLDAAKGLSQLLRAAGFAEPVLQTREKVRTQTVRFAEWRPMSLFYSYCLRHSD